MAEIIVMFGGSTVSKYIFNQGTMVVGRARDSDIVIDNLAVSRKHARLSREGDDFFVTDLRSGNGTFVNGIEVQKQQLRHKDEILVGKHTLIFRNPTEDQAFSSDVFGGERTMLVAKAHVGYLVVTQGKQMDAEFRIRKPKVTIGRSSDCDFTLRDWRVGKEHAVIFRQGDDYLLRSSGRWHRTKVNGAVVDEAVLHEGDQIQMGETQLLFGLSEEEVRPGPEKAGT